MNDNQVIIINKMYRGAYLEYGENIGHEIINLYKADDGKNYIYLNPSGSIDKRYNKEKITILLVRWFATRTYKVLAKAEGVRIIPFATYNNKDVEKIKREQLELDLHYGGVKITDLFSNNSYNNTEFEENPFVTFVVDQVIEPKEELFITDNELLKSENTYYIRTKGLRGRTLRLYYNQYEQNKKVAFKDLSNIIYNERLWKEENETQKISKNLKYEKDSFFNFLKIIRREDDELIISNLLAYFFSKNEEGLVKFAKDVLGVNISKKYTVLREKKNIDIMIIDENNVIVIENKIKYNINSEKNGKHNIYSKLVQSQLKKYYEYVAKSEEYSGKKAHYYVFSPNYKKLNLDRFDKGNQYIIIYYNKIYEFYNKNEHLYKDEEYFIDFKNALYKHSKNYYNDLEQEMQRRMNKAIYNYKKTK